MKVLDVTEFYSQRGGGVRAYLTAKSDALCERKHRQRTLAPGPKGASTSKVEFIEGPTLPYDSTYHLLWRVDKIRRAISRENPDILEIHSPYVAAAASLGRRVRARTFFWHSDFIDTYHRVLVPRLPAVAMRPLWAWVRFIASKCDRTIVASRDQETKLQAHGVPGVTRIPMGVDRSVFRPQERAPSSELRLVGIGRFAVEKRWDIVIDAVHRLREHGVRARLVLYGDGPERARLEETCGDAVELAQFETDRHALARALGNADVLVHGCPYETFGAAIAEAVACATPIVVPDRGAAREHVRGASGRTYETGSSEDCARAIQSIVAMDTSELRSAAEKAAREAVSVDEHFDRLLALYASLLEAC